MGRVLHGHSSSPPVDCVPMGIPDLRGAASDTAHAVQAQGVPLEPVEDALEGDLGHHPELCVFGDVHRRIPM